MTWDEMCECEEEDWEIEFVKPYFAAHKKFFSLSSCSLISDCTVDVLTSLENDFWEFINDFGMTSDETTPIFNQYLAQTRKLRMNPS